MEAIAKRSLAAVILKGRPPLRPLARAEASPATMRSEINSRSNSAKAAKMPKTSLPAAVVVSIAAPRLVLNGKRLGRRQEQHEPFLFWDFGLTYYFFHFPLFSLMRQNRRAADSPRRFGVGHIRWLIKRH
jgi:hypothetical protein